MLYGLSQSNSRNVEAFSTSREVHKLKPSTFKMAEAPDQNLISQKMKKSDIELH